jgi:hypothetical protein
MAAPWWAARVRQAIRHVTGRVTSAERAELAAWLGPAQLRLFDAMHRADQRHGLDVVAALRSAGHGDPALLLAGLLHDCAKGPRTGLAHRVAWSLAQRHGQWLLRPLRPLPGWAAALDGLRDHPRRSAELAREAGCPERTAALILAQDDPGASPDARALHLADEAS